MTFVLFFLRNWNKILSILLIFLIIYILLFTVKGKIRQIYTHVCICVVHMNFIIHIYF